MTEITIFDQELNINPYAISIIGLAKNVGKTTAMNHLLKRLSEKLRIGVTSTGWDGERFDSITGLPKPSISLKKGTYVATTTECLKRSSEHITIIEATDMSTALGKVVIAKAEEDGKFELAGPSTIADLYALKKKLIEYGCKLIIFDGSINRKASSSVKISDGIILSTGLNAGYGLNQVKTTTIFWKNIYSLSVYSKFSIKNNGYKYCTYDYNGEITSSSNYIENTRSNEEAIAINGAFTESIAQYILQNAADSDVIIEEPSSCFITPKQLSKLNSKHKLYVKNKPYLHAVTINPTSTSYKANPLDFFKLMSEICSPYSVYDVKAGLKAVR